MGNNNNGVVIVVLRDFAWMHRTRRWGEAFCVQVNFCEIGMHFGRFSSVCAVRINGLAM